MNKEQEEINKYLTEIVTGIPYKELPAFTNYFTWKGFGKLWEWAIEEEWWEDFLETTKYGDPVFDNRVSSEIIDPGKLAEAVAEYLQEQ